MINFYKKIRGFTLSEVLITLVIIGVIAALTIPTLIKNNNKQETISQLKKVYSTLNQAIKQAEVQNGPCSTWAWSDSSDSITVKAQEADDIMKNILLPQLKVLKYCGLSANKGCFASGSYKDIDGNPIANIEVQTTYSRALLANGTSVFLSPYQTEIWFDINGHKGPNQLGYDYFMINIDKANGRLIPPASYSPHVFCSKNSSNMGQTHGATCLGRIMNADNWNINYW